MRGLFDAITEGLILEGRVELRGFGVFSRAVRKQHEFLNPKNGELYPGGELDVIRFKPSSRLKVRLSDEWVLKD